MDHQKVKINDGNNEFTLEFQRELGRGAFGSVHLAVNKENGKEFAVKKSTCINNETYLAATQEIQILVKLNHVNIAKLEAFDFHQNNAFIVMEYCDGGDLNKRLINPVDEGLKVKWIGQLIDALSYLHQNKIIHRDLKPENVLLKGEVIKLTDFGISKFYYGQGNTLPNSENNLSNFLGTFAGTPYWVAPEMFDQRYTDKADLFSLGVICYAILHREFFVYDGQKYYGVFVEHTGGRLVGLGLAMFEQNREILPSKTYENDTNINHVVVRLLRKDPDARISLADAKEFISISPGDSLQEDEDEDRRSFKRNVGDNVDVENGNTNPDCEEHVNALPDHQANYEDQQEGGQQLDFANVSAYFSYFSYFVVGLYNFLLPMYLRLIGHR